MKGIFTGRTPLFQAGILAAMLFVGFFIGQIIIAFIYAGVAIGQNGNAVVDFMKGPVWALQTTQFIAAIFTFLLPAFVTAWICSNQPKDYLNIQFFPDIRLLGVVCLTTLLISPTVSLTGYFNSQLHLPASMAGIEEWIKSSEKLAEALVQKMIAEKDAFTFIINFFIIAIVAGITEEFLFRGALLRIIRQKIKNHHVAIWIVAMIFSAIHFQFYGFIPRMILGAYLGYLIYWTKNIWIPVFAHFFHNAVAFIGMSNDSLKDNAFFANEISPDDIWWLSITTCICLTGFFYCLKVIRRMR